MWDAESKSSLEVFICRWSWEMADCGALRWSQSAGPALPLPALGRRVQGYSTSSLQPARPRDPSSRHAQSMNTARNATAVNKPRAGEAETAFHTRKDAANPSATPIQPHREVPRTRSVSRSVSRMVNMRSNVKMTGPPKQAAKPPPAVVGPCRLMG